MLTVFKKIAIALRGKRNKTKKKQKKKNKQTNKKNKNKKQKQKQKQKKKIGQNLNPIFKKKTTARENIDPERSLRFGQNCAKLSVSRTHLVHLSKF